MTEQTEEKPKWQEVVELKKNIQKSSLSSYVNAQQDELSKKICAESDLGDLCEKLLSGTWKAESVVRAYCQQAAKAHQKTNCLSEVMFIDAIEQARTLDEHFAATGSPAGPLHGVPVTVKDQFNVTGYDTTLGYVARAFKPATQDAVLVDMLQKLGAIVIAKTTLPQSIMWCETESPLWGLTTHPSNPELTPGGSTGGEGALLAMQSTILGFGTDIGGSVRIPASMCGVYALKPSSGRLPYYGVEVSTDGQEHVPSVVGPMARSLGTLTLAMRALLLLTPWTLDPKCQPVPWSDEVYAHTLSRPLTIGIMADDGVVRPHPPIERHLARAKELLRAAGHTIVEWEPVGHADIVKLMDEYYTVDGGEDVRTAVEAGGESFIPHVAALLERGKKVSVFEYWALNRRKVALQKAYMDRWNDYRGPDGQRLDVLLTPVMPHTAVKHRQTRWVGYTKVWNVLDYTAAVFPVGTVDEGIDKIDESYECRNAVEKELWGYYDPKVMNGLPVALQVVGQRLEEEKVLAAADVIERVLLEAKKA